MRRLPTRRSRGGMRGEIQMTRETFRAKAKETLEEIVGKPNGSKEQFNDAIYFVMAFVKLEKKLFEEGDADD